MVKESWNIKTSSFGRKIQTITSVTNIKLYEKSCKPTDKKYMTNPNKYICNPLTGNWNINLSASSKSLTTVDKNILFDKFKVYFKSDLIGYLTETREYGDRIVVSGSFGIKTLLENKFNHFENIKANDVDFTISTKNAIKCLSYWSSKLENFFNDVGAYNFTINIIDFYSKVVPVFNYKRFYVINIKYNDVDFIDIAITNMNIYKSMIDIPTSLKVGIPLKTVNAYNYELFGIIYMENVKTVSEYVYKKRNPFVGKFKEKGIKDIKNCQTLCKYNTNSKYREYCSLIRHVNIGKFSKLDENTRNKYFQSLGRIFSL